MKKLFLKFIIAIAVLLFTDSFAQTAGTLTCVFTATTPAGATFYTGTKNTLAAWIQTSTGTFVKTKIRDYGGGTNDHLPTWTTKSGGNTTDATTGATRTNFAAVTFTWSGTNTAGAVVADGTYNIIIEDCWNHGTAGIATSTLSFTKGPTSSTVTPAATNYIKGVTITWQPAVAAAPVASMSISSTKCASTPIVFTDASSGSPTSWSWSFPGGTPSVATTSNVSVTYTAAGTYSVTHTAATSTGTSTPITQTFVVGATPTVAANNATICSGTSANLTASGATSYAWNTGATTSTVSVSPTTTTNYTVTGTISGCTNSKVVTVNVNATPTVAANNATVCSGTSVNLTASGATSYVWNTGATTSTISVSPTTTTNYTVTGTTSGCINSKVVTVNVNATPIVAANNATVCSGISVNLTASGATSYAWNTGATTSTISVSPTSSTNYTVSGTSNGCSGTKVVTVTVNALPNVAVSSTTICAGSTGTLSASGASTYTWNTGVIGANLAVSPSSNTTYTVTGTSAAGCVKTTTASVSVGSAPSIAANSTSVCAGNSVTLTASGVTTYTWNTGANTSSVSVSPTGTTVYTVTGNLTGCSASAIKTLTVAVVSNPTVSANNSTICAGASANILASGATSYAWNTGATSATISVAPTSNTNYTVVGTTAGCVNSKVVSVTVNPLPVVNLAAISGPLCVNSSSVMLSGTPTGGVYSGPGVMGSAFDPTMTGAGTFTISYSYTNTAGCSNNNSKTITVNLCTGVEEFNNNSTISIYPNPVSSELNVSLESSLINTSSIELYDMIGNLIITQKVISNTTTLSFFSLAKGIYTIRVISDNNQKAFKVIKE
jgi:PKD repeat protein